jgi:hypothetical protein
MVNTHSSSINPPLEQQNTRPSSPNPPEDPIAVQLAAIASRLETMDSLAAKIAAIEANQSAATLTSFPSADCRPGKEPMNAPHDQCRNNWQEPDQEEVDSPWWRRNPNQCPHTKMEFPKYDGGDPRDGF